MSTTIDQAPAAGRLSSTLSRDSAKSYDILKLLDKLEELVDSSAQVFGRAVWVNADEFFVHTNKIRAFLPEAIKKAAEFSREQSELLEQAQEEVQRYMQEARAEAGRIVQNAETQATQLVDSSEVKRLAEEEAMRIVERAEQRASQLKQGADDYAKDVLSSAQGYLESIVGSIERGKAKLDNKERLPSE